MAPQQNSTLIDDNLNVCPSMTNIPEEIIRCSPILPPKNKKIQQNQNTNNNNKCNKNNNHFYNTNDNDNVIINNGQLQDVKFVRSWELALAEKGTRPNLLQHKHKYHRNGSIHSGHSRRSRSISLYGTNSIIEQGHKEITIWLGDEPRYVSGVTNKTTCNDIIKALIDDEIRCGNYDYCQPSKDGTASRDYSDYVVTECWRGIERSYDNNMAILPVWKAWSRVHNEIRLSLKHYKDIQEPTKTMKSNTTLSSIRDCIRKLLKFGRRKSSNKKKAQKSKTNLQSKEETLKEIMLVLDTPSADNNQKIKRKNSNLKPTKEESEIEAKTKINKNKLHRLSEPRSTQRKRRSTRRRKEYNNRNQHCHNGAGNFDNNSNYLRRRKDSTIRNSVRSKLAQKNAEIDELYDREYALTKELTNKCKLYKQQNELYTSPDQELNISVGQIQSSIEAYAKEIIRTEHELLEIKNEIKQDISIVNNLKRLTLEADPNECGMPINAQKLVRPDTKDPQATLMADAQCENMQFVDNIYEFCDNNASMLV